MTIPTGDQFKDVPHPDSDTPSEGSFNLLGCSVKGCTADFNHPMTRSWHITQRHPGEYPGATEEMDMFERVTGLDMGFNKRYVFKQGAPKPVRGVDFGPGLEN